LESSISKIIATDTQVELPEPTYAIGLYEGKSPFSLKPSNLVSNPIISRNDIGKEHVNFVADPFAIFEDGTWYLFYESMEIGTRKGKICVTTSSDLKTWSESKVVLEESFHLSYPHVFKEKDTYYMIPDTYENDEVRLYKSTRFPFEWTFEKVLLPISCVDSTLIRKDNYWWLFTCDDPSGHGRLSIFYSEDLYGEWKEHPANPIYENSNDKSRPSGKILEHDGRLYRFAQNCGPFYGHSIRAFEIEKLNTTEYAEKVFRIDPFLSGGDEEWNGLSMHHLDLHQLAADHWIAFVDGRPK